MVEVTKVSVKDAAFDTDHAATESDALQRIGAHRDGFLKCLCRNISFFTENAIMMEEVYR